jgi:hypothetical protein
VAAITFGGVGLRTGSIGRGRRRCSGVRWRRSGLRTGSIGRGKKAVQ